MPNRVIRSGFLDSDKINSLKPEEQLFFVRLMLVADDYGCFDARPEMLRSACYPMSDIRPADVSKWLTRCREVGLVVLYEESGKIYLVIKNFDQRLRQKKRKHPQPPEYIEDTEIDGQMSDKCQTIDGHLHARMPESESESESETETEKKIVPEFRECSELLKKRILEHRQQKITDKTLFDWDTDVRLMIERDGRKLPDIKHLINECHDMEPTSSGFTWRNNILSMKKLREKWNDGKIFIGMNKPKERLPVSHSVVFPGYK